MLEDHNMRTIEDTRKEIEKLEEEILHKVELGFSFNASYYLGRIKALKWVLEETNKKS